MNQAYEAAQRLVEREVLVCVSSMIGDLGLLVADASGSTMNKVSFYEDDLFSLQVSEDWDEPVEDYIRNCSRDYVIEFLTETGYECYDEESTADLREAMYQHLKSEGDDAIREFANAAGIEPYQRDVYEHWAVTPWLADMLRGEGEVVVEIFNLQVWGRCTTGQSIALDHVIQKIATEVEA